MENKIKANLRNIAKKISRIEERNINFKFDKTWQNLRAKQDALYRLLAKEQLKQFENKVLSEYQQKKLQRINDFLGDKNGSKKEN